jgi:hypothetical protein
MTDRINEGYYVAVYQPSGLQVAYDRFSVTDSANGLLVESCHTVLGGGIPAQTARFHIDHDWTPRRLEIHSTGGAVTAEFNPSSVLVRTKTDSGEESYEFRAARERAYFILSGGLYFPLHVVRRLDLNNPRPQLFDLVPEGICAVTCGPEEETNGKRIRKAEMRLSLGSVEDLLSLTLDTGGNLLRYQTRNQQMSISLEDQA